MGARGPMNGMPDWEVRELIRRRGETIVSESRDEIVTDGYRYERMFSYAGGFGHRVDDGWITVESTGKELVSR